MESTSPKALTMVMSRGAWPSFVSASFITAASSKFDAVNRNLLPGLSQGSPGADAGEEEHTSTPEETEALERHSVGSRPRLVEFLKSIRKPYAEVDVRAGVYTRLHELISPKIKLPFRSVNSRDHRGGEHGKKDWPSCNK